MSHTSQLIQSIQNIELHGLVVARLGFSGRLSDRPARARARPGKLL